MTYVTPPEPVDPINPDNPASTAQAANQPVEAKTKASTISATAIAGVILTILSTIEGDQLVEGLPDWVSVLIGMIIAALGTFAAGYNAPHTARPDLPQRKR